MTDAESLLWQRLRYKQVNGHRFRRQHPIEGFVADFVCIESKLVIELDGGQHQEQVAYGAQRAVVLQAQGWRVLRFWNNDVLSNIEGILSEIEDELEFSPSP